MEGSPEMYGLVQAIINMLLQGNVVWVTMPFLIIFLLTGFLNWVISTAKGENEEEISADFEDTESGGEARARYRRHF